MIKRTLASNSAKTQARKDAQRIADECGHKVYLQMVELGYPSTEMDVAIMDDGRGPLYLGMPWREFFPSTDTAQGDSTQ